MKPMGVGLCFALFVALASGRDRLPREDAQRYAKVCVEQAGQPDDAQIKMDVDPEKASAVRGEGGGAMVVPDKKLSKGSLAKVGKNMVPVGQVWLRKWTLVVGGKAVSEKLRAVTVNVEDKNRPMILLLLSARSKGEKGMELVVYGKGSEPVQVLPLKTVEFIQDVPLELDWQRGEKNVDPLTLNILGKYQAVLDVTRTGK